MGYTLPGKLTKTIFTYLALSFIAVIVPLKNNAHAHTDIAFRFNGDINNGFAKEALAQISSGTDMHFADSEWNGSAAKTGEDQSGSVIPFNETDFVTENPPTLAFKIGSQLQMESNGTAIIEVELVEANDTAVTADVIFLSGPSSASASDIGGYSTQSLSFSDTDRSGTTKAVTVTISNDSEYEDMETAVFKLQNSTTGGFIGPEVLNLHIQDDDAPDIVINEIHADPDGTNGDADGNGSVSSSDDEFIEFVNNEPGDIDISNWTVSDSERLRHTFPTGTVIPAGGVLVLFADDQVIPTGNFGGAIVQSTNRSPTLGLANSGDTIELADHNGDIVAEYTYGSEAADNQSITRDPDVSGPFIKHSVATGSGGALFSPGTKADGTPFGSRFAVSIRGSEGWHMISSPTQNISFNDLLGSFWMQGLTGSDAPAAGATIYEWDEERGGSFSTPSNMSNVMEAGKGYMVYFFEDNEFNTPGVQGGFPKILNSNESENNSPVTIPVSANDYNGNPGIDGNEGWNLLGNPFGSHISVDAVLAALQAVDENIQANLQVWDHNAGGGNGAYIDLTSGDTISPFQAFWVRYTEAGVNGSATFNRGDLVTNKDAEFYKEQNEEQFSFEISLGDGTYFDQYQLLFSNKGSIDLDRYDAFKLFSMKPNAINLYSQFGNNKLMKNVLPADLDASIEISLDFDAPGRESLKFSWQGLEKLPRDWKVTLRDRKLNKETDLRSAQNYGFTVPESRQRAVTDKNDTDIEEPQLDRKKSESNQPRFVLSLSPVSAGVAEPAEMPESVKLNPNYPNPFNPTTTITYELKEDSEVLLSIWNIVGQKVITLVDGVQEAGEHTATWNASEMPSGIYIAQLEVGSEVFIRKMTLIK